MRRDSQRTAQCSRPVDPEHLWRGGWRPDWKRSAVFLRQLRGHTAAGTTEHRAHDPDASLCAGNINYLDGSGNLVTITPTQLQGLDPLGLGINPAIENASHTGYFDKTFCTGQFKTNDSSVGDGLNYSGYRFRAPVKLDNNAFIARLDYHVTADGKHSLFWRGSLQNIYNPQAPFLPGSPPEQTVTDHSKGFGLGYTAVLSPSAVNTFRWGFP